MRIILQKHGLQQYHFTDSLLDRVAQGEQITITRHGVPVAMLVPASGARKPDVRETINAMIEARKGCRLDGLSIREMIEEGRR